MSSHREAPAITLLSALAGVPTLAALQMGSILASEELEHVDASSAEKWHVNLNITDFYVFSNERQSYASQAVRRIRSHRHL